jgi:hypothetical protein
MPTKIDRARSNQKLRMEEKAAFVEHMRQNIRQHRRTIRSGYAFSQQEGWGPLITSGRMQSKATTSRVRPSQIAQVTRRIDVFVFNRMTSFLLHALNRNRRILSSSFSSTRYDARCLSSVFLVLCSVKFEVSSKVRIDFLRLSLINTFNELRLTCFYERK